MGLPLRGRSRSHSPVRSRAPVASPAGAPWDLKQTPKEPEDRGPAQADHENGHQPLRLTL